MAKMVLSGHDHEFTIGDIRIIRMTGVILPLIIAPAITAMANFPIPNARIDIGAIKFV